jgi:hypothetical protein
LRFVENSTKDSMQLLRHASKFFMANNDLDIFWENLKVILIKRQAQEWPAEVRVKIADYLIADIAFEKKTLGLSESGKFALILLPPELNKKLHDLLSRQLLGIPFGNNETLTLEQEKELTKKLGGILGPPVTVPCDEYDAAKKEFNRTYKEKGFKIPMDTDFKNIDVEESAKNIWNKIWPIRLLPFIKKSYEDRRNILNNLKTLSLAKCNPDNGKNLIERAAVVSEDTHDNKSRSRKETIRDKEKPKLELIFDFFKPKPKPKPEIKKEEVKEESSKKKFK